jgi:hypothetical protein
MAAAALLLVVVIAHTPFNRDSAAVNEIPVAS